MISKILIISGLILIILGIIIWIIHTYFPNLKKLPGDILIQHKNFTVFIPIMTSILLSILISIVLYVINRSIK